MSEMKKFTNVAVLHTARSLATVAGLIQASPATILATMVGFARTTMGRIRIVTIMAGDTAMALA
jgi:hypothetical protein